MQLYKKTSTLVEQLGLKYIHLRIFSVYGENDHDETLIKSSIKKLRDGNPIAMASGGQMWNYIYVKDAARQIVKLSIYAVNYEDFKQEVFNIASNDTRRLQDFVITMKEVWGSASELSFSGYNKYKDVNLNPDISKTASIVKPLTKWNFESVIRNMKKHILSLN